MCPACLTSALLMVAGTGTAGGVAALLAKALRARREPARETSDVEKENRDDA